MLPEGLAGCCWSPHPSYRGELIIFGEARDRLKHFLMGESGVTTWSQNDSPLKGLCLLAALSGLPSTGWSAQGGADHPLESHWRRPGQEGWVCCPLLPLCPVPQPRQGRKAGRLVHGLTKGQAEDYGGELGLGVRGAHPAENLTDTCRPCLKDIGVLGELTRTEDEL